MQTSKLFEHSNQLTRDELSFCQSSVESIQAWIVHLTDLSLGYQAKALLSALTEISELKCQERLRFDLLQALYPCHEQIVNCIENHVFSKILINNERKSHLIELLFLLQATSIKVYFYITQRCHQQQIQPVPFYAFKLKRTLRITRILASYYALQQLSRLLYQQQRTSAIAIPKQWYITHQLMYLAMQRDDQNMNINRLQGTQYPLHNIHQIYAQIILLSILNTHQLQAADLEGFYLYSIDWAKKIHISQKQNALSRYSIDVNQDHPPRYDAQQTATSTSQVNIFIVTQHLLQHLDQYHRKQKHYASNDDNVYLTPVLYFHIHHLLTENTGRRYARFSYNATLTLYLGLEVAHHYLLQEKKFKQDLKTYHQSQTTPINPSFQYHGLKQARYTFDHTRSTAYYGTVLNMSVHGYRIRWRGKKPLHVTVGEFILIQENQFTPCFAGVIRWIQSPYDQDIEMGLEVLAQDLTPCVVSMTQMKVTDSDDGYAALIIQNKLIQPNNMTLIVPNMAIFKTHTKLLLSIGITTLQISLGKTMLMTQSIAGFSFEPVIAQEQIILDQLLAQSSYHIKPSSLI